MLAGRLNAGYYSLFIPIMLTRKKLLLNFSKVLHLNFMGFLLKGFFSRAHFFSIFPNNKPWTISLWFKRVLGTFVHAFDLHSKIVPDYFKYTLAGMISVKMHLWITQCLQIKGQPCCIHTWTRYSYRLKCMTSGSWILIRIKE